MFEEIQNKPWPEIISTLMDTQHNITEIETNGNIMRREPVSLFIKQNGKRIEIKNVWHDPEEYSDHIGELIMMIGQDEKSKFLAEGRIYLETGETARVHIVLEPASDYPQVTIAKKSMSLGTLDALEDGGMFNRKVKDLLTAIIDTQQTCVLSGPTGAGKTTLLEAMTKHINESDRIGIVEDSQELQLIQQNVTYLHSTLWKPGMSINDVATLSWCVQQLNRQRVDKIIIGETRGGEFADFIVAANSGCEGSMTTIHANNAKTALSKMSNFMTIGIPQPTRSANESIAQSIQFIIQLGFDNKGRNKLLGIENVSNTLNNDESASIATSPIVTYNKQADKWEFQNYLDDATRERFVLSGYDPITFRKKGFSSGNGLNKNKFNFKRG